MKGERGRRREGKKWREERGPREKGGGGVAWGREER